jgi:hypothetical protein
MNVCMFECIELIQIHISETISIKLCTRLPLGLEETNGPEILDLFDHLGHFSLEATAESWA